MKSEVKGRGGGARDELLARILDAAARIKKHKVQLRRTKRDFGTRIAKCVEVDVGFSKVLQNVTHSSFLCSKFVFQTLNYV
jgi:hypothetical protein